MASGDTLVVFTSADAVPDDTNFPQPEIVNNHQVLSFDAGTNEICYFEGVMPSTYSGITGVTVQVVCISRSGTSGTLEWEASFERNNNGLVISSDSFASSNNVTITIGAANTVIDGAIPGNTIAFTNGAEMDSVAAGEAFRLKVLRDASTDSCSSDCALMWVIIKET